MRSWVGSWPGQTCGLVSLHAKLLHAWRDKRRGRVEDFFGLRKQVQRLYDFHSSHADSVGGCVLAPTEYQGAVN